MSDDAFAVTPAPAQPPQRDEAIYQALHAALSANSRGRWFLSEFARRNRNSESSKMLDAVARIEQAVATRPAVAAASSDLEIARNWAVLARADAASALGGADRDAIQTGAQRGARIIREVATSMRAVGNDPRICRILDEQLDAIEAAQRIADAPAEGVLAAFDRLIAQLDELIPAPTAARIAEVTVLPEPSSTPKALARPVDPEARFAAVADLAVACAVGDPKVDLKADPAPEPSAAEAAEDEAMLAVIAAEMGAPDLDPQEAVDNKIDAAPPATIMKVEPPPATTDQRDRQSLGAAVLAHGVLKDSLKPARDPFADVKKLTQAEKVALFT